MAGTGVLSLAEAAAADPARLGGKAHTLALLAAAGFDVPPGFVVTEAAFALPAAAFDAAVRAAVADLGAGPFAVRSSAVAEDLADASYAGLYETLLDVAPAAVPDAARRCRASAGSARVAGYHGGPSGGEAADPGMAVLVQPMIAADAAGVAFTADPVTGARDEAVVTAVRGLGRRLVDGEAVGDEWGVPASGAARPRRVTEHAIDAAQAAAVAALARRVAERAGTPQDVEWAVAGARLWLLQARPMTALPDPVRWQPPGPGVWQRNFRLGEWLTGPVTPLFADWLLPRIEAGFADGMRATAGTVFEFPRAIVNGWYYATPTPRIRPVPLLAAVAATRGRLLRFMFHALVEPMRDPVAADRALLGALYRRWRERLLPGYRSLVAAGEAGLDAAEPTDLVRLVDEVGRAAGVHLWYLAIVGGAAWKMERALHRFVRRNAPGVLPDGVAVLLAGAPSAATHPGRPAPYAVTSLDWYHPTFGELGGSAAASPAAPDAPGPPGAARPPAGSRARDSAEDACRAALADRPRQLRRFAALLAAARRYAAIREEQSRELTLGWPLLRRAVHRLGESALTSGAIDDADDAFFLTRAELAAGYPAGPGAPRGTGTTAGPARLRDAARARREAWRRQRRLAAPLSLGAMPAALRAILAGAHGEPAPATAGAVAGQGASPGRVTGPVRVVRTGAEFDGFRAGEVLVAPTTTPAWAPLLARAAAVVTDGGTLAAHASLLAREYAIPAVVGTGEATRRLVTGQLVTVDGTAGTVVPAAPPR